MASTLLDLWKTKKEAKVNGHAWKLEPSVGFKRMHLWREVRVSYQDRYGIVRHGWRIIKIERPLDLVAEAAN